MFSAERIMYQSPDSPVACTVLFIICLRCLSYFTKAGIDLKESDTHNHRHAWRGVMGRSSRVEAALAEMSFDHLNIAAHSSPSRPDTALLIYSMFSGAN